VAGWSGRRCGGGSATSWAGTPRRACRGLTTFSAFALINAQHLDDGSVGWAALSIGAVMVCGLAAATVTRLVVERRRDDGGTTT
jgi:hypothetical protein